MWHWKIFVIWLLLQVLLHTWPPLPAMLKSPVVCQHRLLLPFIFALDILLVFWLHSLANSVLTNVEILIYIFLGKMRPTQGLFLIQDLYLSSMGRPRLVLGSKGSFSLLWGSSFTSLVEAFSLSLERVTPALELKFEILGPINNFFFWFVICLYEKLLQIFAN